MVRPLAAWNVKVIFGVAGNKMLALGLMPLGVEVKSPDFSAYAWASGAKGFLVEDAAQLEDSLRIALNLQAPAVVEVCRDVRLPAVNLS